MSFPIVFENERIVVVDKPHGWLSTPSRDPRDPRACLGRELQKQLNRQIYPVHRLDFEVSGLTLWAKDPECHTIAQKWFEDLRVGKIYHAFSDVRGEPPTVLEDWKSNLAKGKRRAFAADHGKPSLTHARVISVGDQFWTWELIPVTGRPHQLRFEMSHHGYPIVGDVLYGGRPMPKKDWIALRAVKLDFTKLIDRLRLPSTIEAAPLDAP